MAVKLTVFYNFEKDTKDKNNHQYLLSKVCCVLGTDLRISHTQTHLVHPKSYEGGATITSIL